MRKMVRIILLACSAISAICTKDAVQRDTRSPSSGLGWQAHSQNDLRLWPQLAKKSTRPTLSIKVDPHNLTDRGFQLTHDDPVQGVVYDTTEDLLAMCQKVLKGWPALNLRVAMCFKDSDPCSPSSETWRAGVDKFYEEAEKVRAEFRDRLEFVLDGTSKPYECLKDRWRPWNSTWMINDHSPPEALFSNNVSEGYDRYQVLNPPDNHQTPDVSPIWSKLKSENWGKFLHGPYPFQLWEPDNQTLIDSYADMFVNGPHVSNPKLGFDFAINIDPQMWTLFTAKESKQAWNLELALPASDASAPLFASLGANGFMFVLYKDSGEGKTMWSTLKANSLFGEVTVLKSGAFGQDSAPVAIIPEGDADVHVVTASGIEHYTISVDGSLNEVGYVALTALPGPLASCMRSAGVYAALLPGKENGTLEVKQIENGVLSRALWVTPALPDKGRVAAADLVAVGENFLVTASNGTHVFVAISGHADSDNWTLLGVGVHMSLSTTTKTSGEAIIALTADGGFCFNSFYHNTQASPKLCDQTPVPCKTALDYTIGTGSQWLEFIRSSKLVTPCNEFLLHGTYDFGVTPSSTLISNGSSVSLLAMHAGVGAENQCKCGSTVPRPAGKLVLDGFMLDFPDAVVQIPHVII